MDWQEIRDRKLAARDALLKDYFVEELPLPDELNDVTKFVDTLFTDQENEIFQLTIPQLQQKYLEKTLSVSTVVKKYCRRATVGHQLVNFITEVRFEQALQEAVSQDEYLETHKKLIGPLHGVVVSLKDNINIEGFASSMGFVGLADKIATSDAAIVKLFKRLGAVIICKTNTSAGMMYSETTNVLWGRTLNPFSRKYLNGGGSSGGEGAIGALRGSCFGIGSDIGGSVRHPAALNGIFSIKPSFGRVPTFGTESGQPGQESIKSIYGVLSYYLENVQYVLQTIIDSKPYRDIDPGCLPLEYRPYRLEKQLKIAFLDSDGTSTATAPLKNALDTVRGLVEGEGHSTVDWTDKYLLELTQTIYPFFGANGYRTILDLVAKSKEPVDHLLSKWFPTAEDLPVSKLWELQKKRTGLVQKYMELWNEHGIDAIIMPASPFPACLKDKVVTLPCTAVWNGLDYTVATLRVGTCDVSRDVPVKKSSYISEVDRHVHETYQKELVKFDGAAISLQVVCRRLEEEKALEITQFLASLVSY
ncbi:hypothetical protein OGAPHI_000551 [Ogataea philodendri]|uniref:Amidase domain-containing protein n=1 Tax=Ogataea philodendri TaxID=1378263 RepID=A0A9P8T9G5_9ASCO|nr:uncharacterized protein OGAPHI_000551 [Ogataea philodendri]KAH3671328.1 hypothetical protein OGAPHI_000551 [Ogataea philodendri]